MATVYRRWAPAGVWRLFAFWGSVLRAMGGHMRIIWRNSYMWTGIWPYRTRRALVFTVPWAWWVHWQWLRFSNWYNMVWSAQQAQIAFFQAGGEDMSDARWAAYLNDDLNTREFLALMIATHGGNDEKAHD